MTRELNADFFESHSHRRALLVIGDSCSDLKVISHTSLPKLRSTRSTLTAASQAVQFWLSDELSPFSSKRPAFLGQAPRRFLRR
eukprot:2806723-Pleurochrysis_carterae.AAC.1